MKKIVKWAVLLGLIAAAGWGIRFLLQQEKGETAYQFQQVKAEKKDILRYISAIGTVEPEELINVGAQVNGKIMSFGKDAAGNTVDFASKVTAGMVLAQIDDVIYKAELQECEAKKEQALASIASAECAIKECRAREKLALSNYERAQTLYAQKSMTRSDFDSALSAYDVAAAATASANASLLQAKASLSIAEASLVRARRNLEYCTITSPVDGIVIDRRVSVGQTVVSNQSASSIFLVAKDFRKMQVWASVNEADVGYIKPGMKVEFTCDTLPGEIFTGTVFRIRLNATLSSNVVTYIVEINVPNEELKLIPYLTANVKFIQSERRGVLTLPNSALRLSPPDELIGAPIPELKRNQALIWQEQNGKLIPTVADLGLSDGLVTEILGEDWKEGDRVITGIFSGVSNASDARAGSPFLPKPPQRRNTRGQK